MYRHLNFEVSITRTGIKARKLLTGHIDTDTAVVDCNGLEVPKPIPVHEDGGLDVVEDQVTGGKLLVAQEGPVMATIEG